MRTPSKKPTEQPATWKGKVRTTLVCGVIALLGVWMTVRPESPFRDAIERGESVRKVIWAIDWIWGVTGGIVLVALAMAVVAFEFMPPRKAR